MAFCNCLQQLTPGALVPAGNVSCTLRVNGVAVGSTLTFSAAATPVLLAAQLLDEGAGTYIEVAGYAEPVPLVSSVQAVQLLILGAGFGSDAEQLQVRSLVSVLLLHACMAVLCS